MEPPLTAARVSVLGAGSWGTALAILLARNGHPVRLWDHDPDHVEALARDGENRRHLPGIPLVPGIQPCTGLAEALEDSDWPLIVVPSHGFRSVLARARERLSRERPLAWATKGLEMASGQLLHQVARAVLGADWPLAAISGPSFAREVALGLPTAVTVAAPDPAWARSWADLLRGEDFRPYTSTDLVGVELGGALKNVLAIAAGIADGLGFGANSRAALITRGLAEMVRLGEALGGRRETFMGLAGLGDLVLTCTDDQSRNRRLGLALGRGQSRAEAEAAIDQVVEGIDTAREIRRLGQSRGIELPITEQVYRVLYEDLPPREAVRALLARKPRPEA